MESECFNEYSVDEMNENIVGMRSYRGPNINAWRQLNYDPFHEERILGCQV
jgi:hypothetical protein